MAKCERCGDYFHTEYKELQSLCHSCHHIILIEYVKTKWNIQKEYEGYTGWDNWQRRNKK